MLKNDLNYVLVNDLTVHFVPLLLDTPSTDRTARGPPIEPLHVYLIGTKNTILENFPIYALLNSIVSKLNP